MKMLYISPSTEIIAVYSEHYMASASKNYLRQDEGEAYGTNEIPLNVGYTSKGGYTLKNGHGQGEEGGNRSKGHSLWDEDDDDW